MQSAFVAEGRTTMTKLHSGSEFRVRLVLALAMVSSCVPGVNGPEVPPNVDPPSPPSGPAPNFGDPVNSLRPARPVIGGTLLVLDDARTAVAADPDRNRIFFADYRKKTVLAEIVLEEGDEPGRVVADAEGRVHVVLRGGGAVVTLAPNPWHIVGRRPVCSAPRGLAYDDGQRQIHVACAEGELVSLPVEPDAAPVRRLTLDRDLRDVVVDGDALLVSRFRSAEVLTIDRAGEIVGRRTPGSRKTFRPVSTPTMGPPGSRSDVAPNSGGSDVGEALMTASVAWKMVRLRDGEALILHQRALNGEVSETQGGYAGSNCGGIVESSISRVGPLGESAPSPQLPAGPVAVDLAVSPSGQQLAVVSPGAAKANPNGRFKPGNANAQVVQLDMQFVYQTASQCDGAGGDFGGSGGSSPTGGVGGGTGGTGGSDVPPPDGGARDGGAPDDELPPPVIDFRQPTGEAVSVVYDARGHLLVQTREPASIQVLTTGNLHDVVLSHDSRADTGHDIFHTDAGGGIACASCHPEGGDDGRVWTFRNKQGVLEVRRTQNLRGGVMATAPFHWNGDLKSMGTLMEEVFVQRMQGPRLGDDYVKVLGKWIDTIPALPKLPVRDVVAVERGKALFGATGCTSCHNGALLTNNTSVDVGTGRALQVPSLRGVGWRAPFMHDGCAATLRARFDGKCGGTGDKHGATSKLTPGQIDDLVAFVETL
jgi:hypothetical protein